MQQIFPDQKAARTTANKGNAAAFLDQQETNNGAMMPTRLFPVSHG